MIRPERPGRRRGRWWTPPRYVAPPCGGDAAVDINDDHSHNPLNTYIPDSV